MSIAKVIEVICEGDSVESAINSAIAEASQSVKQIRQVDIKHIQALVENNKVARYRVNANLTFVIEH